MITRLTFFMLILSSPLLAQVKVEYKNGTGVYQKVIEAPGQSTTELYNKVNRWVMATYKVPEKVISARLENEMIKGHGADVNGVKLGLAVYSTLDYVFTIDIKDGKVRYTMSDMRVGDYSFETYVFKNDGTVRTNPQATNIVASTDRIANGIITSLEQSLTSELKKDDW